MKKINCLLLLIGIAFVANAQSTFSLQEAKDYAFKYHPTVKNAGLDIKKADLRVKEILSTGLPQISGSVDLNHYLQAPVVLFPTTAPEVFSTTNISGEEAFVSGTKLVLNEDGEFVTVPGQPQEFSIQQPHNLTFGLSANQLIFDGSFFTGLEAARLYKDFSSKQKLQAAIATQSGVEKAYLNALILQENINLLQKNLPVLERTLYEVEQLYLNGFAEEIEADRLKYSLQEISSQIESLRNNEKSALEFLKFAMGYPMEENIILTDKIDNFVNIDAQLLARNDDAKDRIEYNILDQQKALNDLQIEVYRKQYLPRVVGFANYQLAAQRDKFNYLGFNDDNPWFSTFLIGLQVQVPIFDSHNKKHKIAQSEIDAKQMEIAEKIYDQSFAFDIKRSKIAYNNALKNKESRKSNLDLANKIYNVTLIKYKEGIGSSLEVNDAESKMLESQNKYLNALFELVTAYSDLKTAYGIY